MILILIILFSLSIGSFLNVLIYRIPKKESVAFKRSYCTKCKKSLSWFELFPLASFFTQKGRCRKCNEKISWQYPLVELSTAVLFSIIYLYFVNLGTFSISEIVKLVYYFIITSALIVIFFVDLNDGIIPDKITIPSIFISLLYLFYSNPNLIPYLLSGFFAFLFFLFLTIITRGKGMGFGDVKFAFLIGLFLGPYLTILGVYLAFLTGTIASIILILWGKKRFFKDTIPFGPFLVLGTFLAFFLQDILMSKLGFLFGV